MASRIRMRTTTRKNLPFRSDTTRTRTQSPGPRCRSFSRRYSGNRTLTAREQAAPENEGPKEKPHEKAAVPGNAAENARLLAGGQLPGGGAALPARKHRRGKHV